MSQDGMKLKSGEKLRRLREKQSLSQLELAKIIGVERSAIAMYESGQRTPRDLIKIKLAEFFNVSITDLFFDH